MMRLLLILVTLGALGWGGWWVIGSRAVERGALVAVEDARARGWRVDYGDLSVMGFPSRFDTRVTDLDVATPDGLWGLSAPILQAFALSYRPADVIVVAPPAFALATPGGPVDIVNADLRGSAHTAPPEDVRATIVGEGLAARADDWSATLATMQLALRAAAAPDSYDIAIGAGDFAVATDLLDARLPRVVDRLDIDATATLDAPAELGGRLEALALRRAELAVGNTSVTLAGDVEIGADGLPTGTLTLTLAGWRDLLPALGTLGLPTGQTMLLTAGLAGLERDGRVEIPLTLRGGTLSFGAIPLAPLPRLPAPYSP